MTHFDNGNIVMDTDYAPANSTEPLKTADKPIDYVVIRVRGIMEDHIGMVLEDNDELKKILEENPDIRVIARGTSEVSLAELIYTVQSPTRQLYRAVMCDLKEMVEGRFTGDDQVMRELCNSYTN